MPDTIETTSQQTVTKKSVTPVRKTSSQIERELKRVPWQRLALSLIGIIVVAAMWRWAVFHLYDLPEASLTAFASITTNAFYVIAAIVIFMVTGKLVYDWKNQTATTLIDQASHLTEKREEKRDEHIVEESHSVVEVKEAGINAPELKPFGATAVGDDEEGEHNDFER